MACTITWDESGVLFSHSGMVTGEEVRHMNDLMYGDSRFDHIRYQISDYSRVTDNRVSMGDARVVGTLDRASSVWNSAMYIAIVTTDENFLPVVKAYFDSFLGTAWKCGVFDTLDEAYRWVHTMIGK